MLEQIEKRTNVFWFVGAAFGGNLDQTQRFIDEGIWENGSKERYLDTVRSFQPGDRIAIKSH
jgi:5-methylcytosine-specific restriction protein B